MRPDLIRVLCVHCLHQASSAVMVLSPTQITFIFTTTIPAEVDLATVIIYLSTLHAVTIRLLRVKMAIQDKVLHNGVLLLATRYNLFPLHDELAVFGPYLDCKHIFDFSNLRIRLHCHVIQPCS